MQVEEQSAHDASCERNCPRLRWNKHSYTAITGPRAVCIKRSRSSLEYCKASEETLAITHVWSHGQGGRPETTGFNTCLHRRYTAIAQEHVCSSYWMDAPCIPEDHGHLRVESISHINEVFRRSKMTLICDKNLMNIDIHNLTIELRETILAALALSDWNLRAWTMLEAFQGRHNIWLLFKDNRTVSFTETLEMVHQYGAVDIAILLATLGHLLPSARMLASDPSRDGGPIFELINDDEAEYLLRHRHASRPKDKEVIQQLLTRY